MVNSKDTSFIVPAYNASKTLGNAIDSIINSDRALEIIIVNDGSSDNTREVIEEYSKKYSIIRPIHQENKGASASRNIGIEAAIGEYLCFVDSDDTLSDSYAQKVNNIVHDRQFDLVIFGYNRVTYNKDGFVKEYRVSFPDYEFNSIEKNENYVTKLIKHILFNHIWNKIYRTSIIKTNNIRFDSDVKIGEDYMFNLDYLRHSKKVIVSSACLYDYKESLNGLTHKYYDNKFKELFASRKHLRTFLLDYGMDERIYFDSLIRNIYSYSTNLSHSHSKINITEKRRRINEVINSYEVRSIWKSFRVFKSRSRILTMLVKLRFALIITILGQLRSRFERS